MPANWKVVSEGFSETYHIQGVHPEMLGYIDDDGATQHLWHRHGVSYQDYGVPSPNATMLVWSDMMNVLSTRPGATPDTCQFVITNFHPVPADAARTEPITIGPNGPDVPLGLVMGQDIGIMQTAQRGLHQPGFTHLTVSAEECRVINLHRNLDEWCS